MVGPGEEQYEVEECDTLKRIEKALEIEEMPENSVTDKEEIRVMLEAPVEVNRRNWAGLRRSLDRGAGWIQKMLQYIMVAAVFLAFGWVLHDWHITQSVMKQKIISLEKRQAEHSKRLYEHDWRMTEYHGHP